MLRHKYQQVGVVFVASMEGAGETGSGVTIVSVLVIAERRKTVKVAQVTGFMERLNAWPTQVDELGVLRAFQQILTTAREQNLSAHDAAYLEPTMREGYPSPPWTTIGKRPPEPSASRSWAQNE